MNCVSDGVLASPRAVFSGQHLLPSLHREYARFWPSLGNIADRFQGNIIVTAIWSDSDQETPDAMGDITRAYAGELMPGIQINTFANTEMIFPCRLIAKGAETRPLPRADKQLVDLTIRSRGDEYDLYDFVSRNRTTGLMILKNGKTLIEHYELGTTATTRWMSMSMAKSVATTLIGAAIKDGLIGSVDDQLADYLPELRRSGFDGVSVRNLMQMTSGVEWNDTHTDPTSHRRHMLDLQVALKPGAILDYMASRPRIAEPGKVWNYSTGETHVVGALVKAATGRWLSDYLSEKIWSRLGMDDDAYWWLEAPDGLEVAGSGICATLRDYARFGLFASNGGVIDGEPVVPENWFVDAGAPHSPFSDQLGYGYMWWAVANSAGSFDEHAFSARGIFGQYIYINPTEQVVIAINSARSKPKLAEAIPDNDLFNSVVDALR